MPALLRASQDVPSHGASTGTRLLANAPLVVTAVAVFWVAYANGSYGLSARSILGIVTWWTIIVAIGFGVWPQAPIAPIAWVTGALLGLFALVTLASTIWANNAEQAFAEFNRSSLYLGLFVLAVLAGTRRNLGRLCDGMAIGIAAVGIVALASRLFPGLFGTRGLPTFLPSAATRLSFPVGYWNGLGILLALAFPLCLRGSVTGSTAVRRSLWLLPLPALAAAIYLTSSRGAVVTAFVGVVLFVAATSARWRALGATLVSCAAASLAVAVLLRRDQLVNGPLSSSAAHSQGGTAAPLIAGCCILGAVVFLAGARLLGNRFARRPSVGRALVAIALAAGIVALVAAHPLRRLETFRQPPSEASLSSSKGFVAAHLLSGNGSGRWQFWDAARQEFESAPVLGRGAGSYEAWWARHASFAYFIRNAHSLYLDVLGELGLLGFALLVGTFTTGLLAGCRALRRTKEEERANLAALTATFSAFAVAAAIDWVWQLGALAGVGMVCLGLLCVSRSEPHLRGSADPDVRRSRSSMLVSGIALIAAGWLAICALAIPWLAARKIDQSQAAVRHGDSSKAVAEALDARRLQPWAATPYLQLALVEEERGDFPAARGWIAKAISKASDDWRLWLVAARLETKSGEIAAARRSLAQAKSLNPLSPLFGTLPP